MLQFEGDRDLKRPVDDVYTRLTDARFLVTCIPDVETIRRTDHDRASLVLRPGFAFVRGTLDLDMEVADLAAPTSASVLLSTRGIGSTSTVVTTLAFTPKEAGVRVHWIVQVRELGGLLKMVPTGLIRGAAQKIIDDIWTRVEANLEV